MIIIPIAYVLIGVALWPWTVRVLREGDYPSPGIAAAVILTAWPLWLLAWLLSAIAGD